MVQEYEGKLKLAGDDAATAEDAASEQLQQARDELSQLELSKIELASKFRTAEGLRLSGEQSRTAAQEKARNLAQDLNSVSTARDSLDREKKWLEGKVEAAKQAQTRAEDRAKTADQSLVKAEHLLGLSRADVKRLGVSKAELKQAEDELRKEKIGPRFDQREAQGNREGTQ